MRESEEGGVGRGRWWEVIVERGWSVGCCCEAADEDGVGKKAAPEGWWEAQEIHICVYILETWAFDGV